jgi:hypothetical protein
MKKFFLSAAFALIGSIMYANPSNKACDENFNYLTQSEVYNNNYQEIDYGFCGVKVVTSYVNDEGVVVGTTEEWVWLGISSSVAECNQMIRNYAKLIGATVN